MSSKRRCFVIVKLVLLHIVHCDILPGEKIKFDEIKKNDNLKFDDTFQVLNCTQDIRNIETKNQHIDEAYKVRFNIDSRNQSLKPFLSRIFPSNIEKIKRISSQELSSTDSSNTNTSIATWPPILDVFQLNIENNKKKLESEDQRKNISIEMQPFNALNFKKSSETNTKVSNESNVQKPLWPLIPNIFPFNIGSSQITPAPQENITNNFNILKPSWPQLPNVFPFNIANTKNDIKNNKTKPFIFNLPNIFPSNNKNTSKPSGNMVEGFDKLFFPVQSVNKFPPVIEFLVQKIQASQSNYIYEDLSRPPTYDKPVYTLSPEDQIFFNLNTESINTLNNVDTTELNPNNFDYEEISTSTEALFEIIKNRNTGYDNATPYQSPNSEDTEIVSDDLPISTSRNKLSTKIPNAIDDQQGDTVISHFGHPNVVYIKKGTILEPDSDNNIEDKEEIKNTTNLSVGNRTEVELNELNCTDFGKKINGSKPDLSDSKCSFNTSNIVNISYDTSQRNINTNNNNLRFNDKSRDVAEMNEITENTDIPNLIIINNLDTKINETNNYGLPSIVYDAAPERSKNKTTLNKKQNETKYISYGTYGIPNVVFLMRNNRNN